MNTVNIIKFVNKRLKEHDLPEYIVDNVNWNYPQILQDIKHNIISVIVLETINSYKIDLLNCYANIIEQQIIQKLPNDLEYTTMF